MNEQEKIISYIYDLIKEGKITIKVNQNIEGFATWTKNNVVAADGTIKKTLEEFVQDFNESKSKISIGDNREFTLSDKIYSSKDFDGTNLYELEDKQKIYPDLERSSLKDYKDFFESAIESGYVFHSNETRNNWSQTFSNSLKEKLIKEYAIVTGEKSEIKLKEFGDNLDRYGVDLTFDEWNKLYQQGESPVTKTMIKASLNVSELTPEESLEWNKYKSVLSADMTKRSADRAGRTFTQQVQQLISDSLIGENIITEKLQQLGWDINATAGERFLHDGVSTINLSSGKKIGGADIGNISVKLLNVDEYLTSSSNKEIKDAYYNNGVRIAYDLKASSHKNKTARWEIVIQPDTGKVHLVDLDKMREMISANKLTQSAYRGDKAGGTAYFVSFDNPAVISFDNFDNLAHFVSTGDKKYLEVKGYNVDSNGNILYTPEQDAECVKKAKAC